MKKTLYFLLLLLWPALLHAQNVPTANDFNLNFDKKAHAKALPDKWAEWGRGYSVAADSAVKRNGAYSVLIKAPVKRENIPFGCVASTIPAAYRGKEIELRGYLKYNNVETGWAGLMLRVDGPSGPLQFSNMQIENNHGTQEWKQFSIKLPFSSAATAIHIGAILTGTGELWADDFELLIDGKPFTEAPEKKPLAAELDKEFDSGSKVLLGPGHALPPELITDLTHLGKVWGFLKYYHPAVAKGDYNWDYELFRILTPFAQAKTSPERQKIVLSWIEKLGPVGEVKPVEIPKDAILKPDLEWIRKSGFQEALAGSLEKVVPAKRIYEHYYIGQYQNVGNPDFKNENAYSQMHYPDAGFRLLTLYRYWNMIEYFFPYKALIREDWDAVLKEFVPKFINAASETDYKLATLTLIARVKDTHANIYGQHDALENHFGNKYAPVELAFIEGKPVVVDYYNPKLGEASGLKVGDVIETVNGKTIAQIIKEKTPYTPASNEPTRLKNMAPNLIRSNDSTVAVTYKRDGKIAKTNVKVYGPNSVNIYANYNKKDTYFKHITPEVAYIFPGKFKNVYLKTIAPEIMKTKGVIVDMRCYPSDFMVFTFGGMLMPETRPFVKFSVGSLETPGMFTFGPEVKVGGSNPGHYKGKVVVIVNEKTLSQSEYTTMAFSAGPNTTVIGSTTAAADGNVSPIALPGGIRTGISGIGVYYPDGRETQQIGIVPNIEIKPTIKGIAAGRDELLEKALEIINGK
jgi:C-terminal processing protease CtpA/Prc